MSSKLCRTLLLSLVVLGLTAAAPAFAGQPVQAPTLQAPAGCPPAANLFSAPTQVCKANDAVAAPEPPVFMISTTNKYTGYCQCGCRFVKDCTRTPTATGEAASPAFPAAEDRDPRGPAPQMAGRPSPW
ncbi:MAG TPA: hypothetical protein VGH73_12155 [Thermoanaerobaculia bacterium]|jgi:hypothetical protein